MLPAVTAVSVYDVPASTAAMTVPSRRTVYPVTPTLSVDADHDTSTRPAALAADTFAGTDGAAVSPAGGPLLPPTRTQSATDGTPWESTANSM